MSTSTFSTMRSSTACARSSPPWRLPELLAVVEVEGGDGAGLLGGLHRFHDDLSGGGGERRKRFRRSGTSARPERRCLPIEVAGLELRGGLVAAVVENDGSADAEALVAVDGGHVGAMHAIVLEVLVEGLDAHGADALVDEIADGVVHHGGGDAGIELEAIGQIRGYIELAAADVDGKVASPCGTG